MSENKELKKGNGQEPETETAEEGVEGYAYCDSHKARTSHLSFGRPDMANWWVWNY